MFTRGWVCGLSELRLWGEKKKTPTTCRPGSLRAECAPQKAAALCAQGGPLFPGRAGGSGKTPLLLLRKGHFPRGSGARLAAKTEPVPRVEGGFPRTQTLLCKPPSCLKKKKKHPATRRSKTQRGSRPRFRLASEMQANRWVNRAGGGSLVSASHNPWPPKRVRAFPQDHDTKFVLDKCA